MRSGVPSRSRPTLLYERREYRSGRARVAGVDEVGRGSWAGPLVAAAVVLPLHRRNLERSLAGVDDSKALTRDERAAAYRLIVESGAEIAVGWTSHHYIDRHGLGCANREAMHRAIRRLSSMPHVVLIDHVKIPECEIPQISVTRGDSTCLSIAAASVVAKVLRDHWMEVFDRRAPDYGFALHKGYGTPGHRAALHQLGPSSIHRRSFAPVARFAQCPAR